MDNKVAIDTKKSSLLLCGAFLYLWILIILLFTLIHPFPINTAHADELLPDSDKYYIRQFNEGPEEYGIGTSENESIFFYDTLDDLLFVLLSQYPKADIIFEDVQVRETIHIDNSENQISDEEINISISGSLTSSLEGGAYYKTPNKSVTIAMNFDGVEVEFNNFSFEARTVAVKVGANSKLRINKSEILSRPKYMNEYSSGTIFNLGLLNINSSTIKWEDGSSGISLEPGDPIPPKVKGYAIYSFGEVRVDENLEGLVDPSHFEGPGGISIQDGGELFLYNGKLICNNIAEEGYKALLIINAKANLLGGEILLSEESQVLHPVVIKQAELTIGRDAYVEKNIFMGSSDTNKGSSIHIVDIEGAEPINISTIAGGYDLLIEPIENSPGIDFGNHDNIQLRVECKDENSGFSGWSESNNEDSIPLNEAKDVFEGGEIIPPVTIYFYIFYSYIDAEGMLQVDSSNKVERGTSHLIKHPLDEPPIDLKFYCWVDEETNEEYLLGESIEEVLSNHTLLEVMSLNLSLDEKELALFLEDGSKISPTEDMENKHLGEMKLLNVPIDNSLLFFEFNWYFKQDEGSDFLLIEGANSEILGGSSIDNGWYKVTISIKYAPAIAVEAYKVLDLISECELYVNLTFSENSPETEPEEPSDKGESNPEKPPTGEEAEPIEPGSEEPEKPPENETSNGSNSSPPSDLESPETSPSNPPFYVDNTIGQETSFQKVKAWVTYLSIPLVGLIFLHILFKKKIMYSIAKLIIKR